MKKRFALISAALLMLSLAACGTEKSPTSESTSANAVQTSAVETPTKDPETQPTEGRVDEKGGFYVYIPKNWCKMEYSGDDLRIRMFDTPSAPKIQDDTPEIEIQASAEKGSKKDVQTAVDDLLKNEGAKEGKAVKVGGESFPVVSYTNKTEKREYTVYVGLGDGRLTTVTLKGVKADSKEAKAVLGSISFREYVAPVTEATTKAAASTTKKAETTKKDETTGKEETTKKAETTQAKTNAPKTTASEKTTKQS